MQRCVDALPEAGTNKRPLLGHEIPPAMEDHQKALKLSKFSKPGSPRGPNPGAALELLHQLHGALDDVACMRDLDDFPLHMFA